MSTEWLGPDWKDEEKLEHLARLFSLCPLGGIRGERHWPEGLSAAAAEEVCATHPAYAPAYWKLITIREDFGGDDVTDAFEAYEAAGWDEMALLALPEDERRLAIEHEATFQTRDLALRLLMTDERLWHERPEATLEVSELALRVAEVAGRRQGVHLRLVDGELKGGKGSGTRRGLPELEVGIRAMARYLNAHRIRGDFAAVRRIAGLLKDMTQDPRGKSLAEARWLLGTALIDIEEWDDADAALVDAIREYRRLGKKFEATRARTTRVRLMRASGKEPRRYLSAAVRVFRSFTEMDRLRQPALFKICRNNLPLYFLEAGEPHRAAVRWCSIPEDPLPAVEARRVGLGAAIHQAMGRTKEAEAGYRQAIQRFEDLEMTPDAAYFYLHLGELLLLTGRLRESKTALSRAVMLFKASDLRHYVRVAVLGLEETLEAESAKTLRAAVRTAILRASGIVRRHDETHRS